MSGLMMGALLYAAVSAFDYQTREQDLYSEALADRVAARAARSAATRASQGAPDQAAIADMEDWGLKASNVAVAQVRVESLLIDAARRAELTSARIVSDGELEEIGPTRWIHADVQSDLSWTPVFAFLDELGRLQTGFRILSFGFDIEPVAPQQQRVGAPPPAPRGQIRIGLAFPVELVTEPKP